MKYAAACCTVKNEEDLIHDWMAFHKAVGFDHLIIIDHASTDGTNKIVRSFLDQNSVTLIKWEHSGTQMDMYNHIIDRYKNDFYWCAFIDADEFLYPTVEFDIKHVLTDYEGYDAIGVNWLIYGSSGHLTTQVGPTIANYINRSETNFIQNRHIKSVVKLSSGIKAETSHYFRTANGTVDEDFQLLPDISPHGFFESRTASHRKLRVNHYHTRAREDYAKKAKRGFFGSDDGKLADEHRRNAMFQHHDQNLVEDRSALRYLKLMTFYLNSPAASGELGLSSEIASRLIYEIAISMCHDNDATIQAVYKHIVELKHLDYARLAASESPFTRSIMSCQYNERISALNKVIETIENT